MMALILIPLLALVLYQANRLNELEDRIAKVEHPFLGDDDNLWGNE